MDERMRDEEDFAFDQLKRLYPFVDEKRTPLPRCWSTKDKYQYLGLSQNNLRVHYKGQGKTHKDAAAVRANHPIPASCGLYYFEVRIINKGRDGFMGIGLSQTGVSLNRLPGWDKFSYGYHGDDGNSFCSSGSGVPYGPTFTTGDVIGCGLNLVDGFCFYTKNGHNIGIAFTDLPPDLYPTVGLQTPGEVVDANFGQMPFLYDVYEEMKDVQSRIRTTIEAFPLPTTKTDCFNKLISSYLVHHGFSATAESFNRITDQTCAEDSLSIKSREKIIKLVLAGRMSDAISHVQQSYPGLLDRNKNLLFLLKCRQFIEMVAGNDEIRRSSPRSSNSASPASTPPQRSTKAKFTPFSSSPRDSPRSPRSCAKLLQKQKLQSPITSLSLSPSSVAVATTSTTTSFKNGCDKSSTHAESEDVLADVDCAHHVNNGSHKELVDGGEAKSVKNGASHKIDDEADGYLDENAMDTSELVGDEIPSCSTPSSCNSDGNIALVLFGRELHQMSIQLKAQNESSNLAKELKMMQDAFSLMAYSNPWKSPVSYLLNQSQREPVAASLNSAILEMQGYAARPALEVIMAHANRLRDEMAKSGIGSAAFLDPNYYTTSTLRRIDERQESI